MNQIQLIGAAHRLADQYAIEVISSDGVPEHIDGRRWYDTRPMLDQRERSAPGTDLAREVLAYAHERGLISPHPTRAHLVRLTRSAA